MCFAEVERCMMDGRDETSKKRRRGELKANSEAYPKRDHANFDPRVAHLHDTSQHIVNPASTMHSRDKIHLLS